MFETHNFIREMQKAPQYLLGQDKVIKKYRGFPGICLLLRSLRTSEVTV